MTKEAFCILLEYLTDLKGGVRDRVWKEAQCIVDGGEPTSPNDDTTEEEASDALKQKRIEYKLARRQYKRALHVAQAVAQ